MRDPSTAERTPGLRDEEEDEDARPSGVLPCPIIHLPDGAVAERKGRALELRDGEGRLLVRYEDGRAEIAAPSGDLVLAAPSGRVVLKAGTDVTIEAARDLTQRAARAVETTSGTTRFSVEPAAARLSSDRLEITATSSQLATGHAQVVARHVVTTAQRVVTKVEEYELTAVKIVETARDTFREVADLAQSRIGRARTLVRGAFSLRAQRTHVISKEETKIDGKRVLLG
jgi:hypothetical protein